MLQKSGAGPAHSRSGFGFTKHSVRTHIPACLSLAAILLRPAGFSAAHLAEAGNKKQRLSKACYSMHGASRASEGIKPPASDIHVYVGVRVNQGCSSSEATILNIYFPYFSTGTVISGKV